MDRDFKLKTISGIAYNSAGKIIALLLRIVASVVLARGLTASDYGVVGFAMVIIGFLSRFNDLGIGSAVIQQLELDEKGLYTAFSLKLILGISIAALCIILAPYSRHFFNHPDIGSVIQVLATIFVISSFSFLPEVLLTRQLEFKKLGAANVISVMARSIVAIVLVFAGFKYWSIVLAEIGGTLAQVIILNCFCHKRVRFRFDRARAHEFLSFGGKLFGSGLIVFLMFNADNFVIGAAAGAAALGYYALAFNWGSFCCGVLSEGVHSVLLPAFSRTQKDRAFLKNSYLKVLEYVSMFAVLANVILLVNAGELLVYVFGRGTDKWLPALSALQILSVYGIVRMILEPVGNIALALGKPGILFKANALAGVLEIGCLYFALKLWGINGVAVLVTATYAIQYFIYIPFLKNELGITLSEIFAVTKPSLLSGLVIAASALALGAVTGFSIASMVLKVLYCLAGYLALYGVLTGWKSYKEVRAVL